MGTAGFTAVAAWTGSNAMSARDNDPNGSEAVTFRIQADRRKTDALVSGAHERRATSPPSVLGKEAADPADSSERPAWFEPTADRSE